MSTPPATHHDEFVDRHIGPRDDDLATMLATIGVTSLDELPPDGNEE